MRIAFDVDGVVLDSIEVIIQYINKISGRQLVQQDLESWGLEHLGVDYSTLWEAVEYMYEQPNIEPYHKATEVLNSIYKDTGEPLLFITGRHDPESALRQLEALEWNPTPPPMFVTGGKRNKLKYLSDHLVDFIIEDDVEHVEEYVHSGIQVGLMVRPWNCNTTKPISERFEGWDQIYKWYRQLEE